MVRELTQRIDAADAQLGVLVRDALPGPTELFVTKFGVFNPLRVAVVLLRILDLNPREGEACQERSATEHLRECTPRFVLAFPPLALVADVGGLPPWDLIERQRCRD